VVPSACQLIILDFDGVILESVGIKTEAYRELFSAYPRELDRIMEYHLKNLGTSRFDKIRYIYEHILGEDLPPDEYRNLINRFADLVLGKVLRAPFVPGAPEFLEGFHLKLPLYVVSATPEDEIRFIVEERGLSRFFRGVCGAPKTKADCMREILASSGAEPGSAVYVGDAPNDLQAAKAVGIRFVGRVRDGDPDPFTGNRSVEKVVKDLHELGRYLEEQAC
jgi:beta-phosphoglucomutase-like phosphatase (HAD superfamily)